MFLYCFDEEEKQKLQEKQLKVYQETNINNKKCWIFIVEQDNKFNFSEVDKGKCVVTNRMTF